MSTNDLPTDDQLREYAAKGSADSATRGWPRIVWLAASAVDTLDALAAMTPGNDVYDVLATLPNADDVIAETTASMRDTVEGYRRAVADEFTELDSIRATAEAHLPPEEYRCTRCGGHGVYGHHGACFRCGGEGIDPSMSADAARYGVHPVRRAPGYGTADEALS